MPEDRQPLPHLVAFLHSLPHVERALDVGCGDGVLTAELRADSVTAADVSQVALDRAARRLPDATLILLEPDAPLPLDDDVFDLVVCTETLEHVRDTQLFLSEIRRVLRPGGTVALTTPVHHALMRAPDTFSPHLRFYTRSSLARTLCALGFDVVALRRRSGSLLVRATR